LESTRAQGAARGSWNITRISSGTRFFAKGNGSRGGGLKARDQPQRVLLPQPLRRDGDKLAGGM